MNITKDTRLWTAAAVIALNGGLWMATPAQAVTIFQFESAAGNSGYASSAHNAGVITNIINTYNPGSEQFTWQYDTTTIPGTSQFANGFWLVVSPGEHPNNQPTGTYAILYGDLDTGTTYAEVYEQTHKPVGDFIQTLPGSLSSADNLDGTRTITLSFDASFINDYGSNPGWLGIQFGPGIGVWFHPYEGYVALNGSDVTALNRVSGHTGYYDFDNLTTTVVPLPPALWLMLSALLGLIAIRRRPRTRIAERSAIPATA